MFHHIVVMVEIGVIIAAFIALVRWFRYNHTREDSCNHQCAITAVSLIGKENFMETSVRSSNTGSSNRRRLRELGVKPGTLPTGPNNAITDAGVLVGHTTLVSGEGKLVVGQGPVRTGVTVVIPHKDDIWNLRPSCASYVLNGNGTMTGLDYINESGMLEGPIGLTNTLSVGDVYKGISMWMQQKFPEILADSISLTPVVGECDDSALNDIHGFHVGVEHVLSALNGASGGAVAEGAVGAGTGMTCYQFKGGIGTSSRVVEAAGKKYTVGVLVNTNCGKRPQLTIAGVPVGQILEDEELATKSTEGSIVILVATDAPLSSHQLERIAKRACMGLARTGSTANNSSGDFVVAFSTTRLIPRECDAVLTLPEFSDGAITPMFQATAEATAEAVWNALCMADTVVGRDGNVSPGLPLERVSEVLRTHKAVPSED